MDKKGGFRKYFVALFLGVLIIEVSIIGLRGKFIMIEI